MQSISACFGFATIHVDARINYSTTQQRLGMVDEAFETLREYVLDAGSSLPASIHYIYICIHVYLFCGIVFFFVL